MNGISQVDMRMLSNIIFWALHYDTITPQLMMLNFNCKEEFAEASIVALHSLGVLNKNNPGDNKEPWVVMYHELTDIPNDMLNVLQSNGYTLSQLGEALKGMPKEKKKVSSNILTDKTHKWISTEENMPENDTPVIIRLYNPNQIYLENRTEIVYVEDIKIASYNGTEWIIRGPFPLYDFSMCSKMSKVNEGIKVTHWAAPTDKEIDQWDNRYNHLFKYDELKVSIDDEHRESFYRSLILAGSCLAREVANFPKESEVRPKFEAAYKYICDLQTAMDRGGDINALDS